MRSRLRLMLAALATFVVSAILTLTALELASQALAVVAILGMFAAMILFLLSVWLPRQRVDWDRLRTEQRLWESGPLGRKWLRTRQRISDTFRL